MFYQLPMAQALASAFLYHVVQWTGPDGSNGRVKAIGLARPAPRSKTTPSRCPRCPHARPGLQRARSEPWHAHWAQDGSRWGPGPRSPGGAYTPNLRSGRFGEFSALRPITGQVVLGYGLAPGVSTRPPTSFLEQKFARLLPRRTVAWLYALTPSTYSRGDFGGSPGLCLP